MLLSKVLIRSIEKADLDAVAKMIWDSEFAKAYYPNMDSIHFILDQDIDVNHLYLAEYEGEICGMIWFSINGMFSKYPYLNLIFVKSEYRHTGVSALLLDFFEEQSIKILNVPKTKLFLLVEVENENAKEFYKIHEYKEMQSFNGINRKNMNEYLMMKEKFMDLSV